jgi:hypothetical protein
MKKNYSVLFSLFFLSFSALIASIDTSRFEPFTPIQVASEVISVEKVGVAGIYADDPYAVWAKRIDNLGQDADDFDSVHMAEKNRLSIRNTLHNNFRRSILVDSAQIVLGYESNPFMQRTPMDNHMAVSNDGLVVSVINTNIRYTDTLGNLLLQRNMNAAFFGDNSLVATIYDPKILYEPDEDRFILVILHGSSPTQTHVLVCFSRSNRPDVDGWHYYRFNGNVYNNSLWFDYPNTGINKKDLFISGNLFNANNEFSNITILQIDKMQGYGGGNNINSRIWGGITGITALRNDEGNVPFTLVPAPYAYTNNDFEDMYFVSNYGNGGNKIFLNRITAALNNNPGMEVSSVTIPNYLAERFCSQMSTPGSVSPISLIAGDARIKNAFLQDNIIHCVFNARPPQTSFSRIIYSRIDIAQRIALSSSYTDNASDYAFAAIAPFSNNPKIKTTLIVYTSTSAAKYPDIGYIICDKDMKFSSQKLIKEGESFVNILSTNNRTRWGDYSGIAKKFNADRPEIWISASYGAFTPNTTFTRHWRNWNAKITSIDQTEVPLNENRLWPNPVVDNIEAVTFNFLAPQSGNYSVKMYDMSGKLVRNLYEENLLQGEYRISFTTAGFAIGNYIIRYFVDGKDLGYEKLLILSK